MKYRYSASGTREEIIADIVANMTRTEMAEQLFDLHVLLHKIEMNLPTADPTQFDPLLNKALAWKAWLAGRSIRDHLKQE